MRSDSDFVRKSSGQFESSSADHVKQNGYLPMTDSIVLAADDDETSLDDLTSTLVGGGYPAYGFPSGDVMLKSPLLKQAMCIIIDMRMPGTDGMALIEAIKSRNAHVPVIVVTGLGDVASAVHAIKAGAVDFLEKPVERERLLSSVSAAIETGSKLSALDDMVDDVRESVERLTPREREIFALLVAGKPNKTIASELEISPRTVETHRASLMSKMRAEGPAHLVRMAALYDARLLMTGSRLERAYP